MCIPPNTIDGAEVLEWAWSGEKPFGTLHYQSGEIASELYGLAICRYKNSNIVYRFSCNANWETEQDSDYNSIQEAKECLPKQYRNVNVVWNVLKIDSPVSETPEEFSL